MSRNSFSKIAAILMIGSTLSAASAMACEEGASKDARKLSNLASWYDAQRQLTDGKPESVVAVPTDARR